MIKGIDTTFLVQAEIEESSLHADTVSYIRNELVMGKTQFALAPQVLSEFIHVVTDAKRFEKSLSMGQALEKAEFWWNAVEIKHIFPSTDSLTLFNNWMIRYNLGRKRILDTMLGATYFSAGISKILTANVRDYSVFECFDIISF